MYDTLELKCKLSKCLFKVKNVVLVNTMKRTDLYSIHSNSQQMYRMHRDCGIKPGAM